MKQNAAIILPGKEQPSNFYYVQHNYVRGDSEPDESLDASAKKEQCGLLSAYFLFKRGATSISNKISECRKSLSSKKQNN